jgi:hypothetical protein
MAGFLVRSAKARTYELLDRAISAAIDLIAEENAINWFHHCGVVFEPLR